MNSGFIYPEVIADIRMACSRHVAGVASSDDLQRAVQRGEVAVVAVEESDIRKFFTDIEGQLELVKFTVDDNKQLLETQRIAKHVLSWLLARESSGGRPIPHGA